MLRRGPPLFIFQTLLDPRHGIRCGAGFSVAFTPRFPKLPRIKGGGFRGAAISPFRQKFAYFFIQFRIPPWKFPKFRFRQILKIDFQKRFRITLLTIITSPWLNFFLKKMQIDLMLFGWVKFRFPIFEFRFPRWILYQFPFRANFSFRIPPLNMTIFRWKLISVAVFPLNHVQGQVANYFDH